MSYLTTDQFKVNSVKTVGNGERCETELLPLQILYIFVSPLSAVGHNASILVVGSFHHTSRSIHLTSFTISNRLYWIHLELVCCQVAHIYDPTTKMDVLWPTADSGETKM
jgi:hypothetical protein